MELFLNRYLENEISKIKEWIDDLATKNNTSETVIYDGIADVENYLSHKYKILFLLKESYETKGCYKWQVGKIYNQNNIRKFPTLKRVGYIIHGIRYNLSYELIKKTNNLQLANSIESIAWININKIAAKSHSKRNLTNIYNIWKDIILYQFNTYAPNIIICGNTLQYIKKDLEVQNENKLELSSKFIKSVYLSGNRLFIQTVHPGLRLNTENEKIFIESIIQLVKKWEKEIKI